MREITILLSDDALKLLAREKEIYIRHKGKAITEGAIIESMIVYYLLAKYYSKEKEESLLFNFLNNTDYDPEKLPSLHKMIKKWLK